MMINRCDFTLVITNYNKARFVDRAIRSCLMQLVFRRNIEIIVVDDASTDDSMKILREFDSEIRLFENEKNKGVAHASNLALANSNGEYWMRVDADDFLNMYACAFMGSLLDENSDLDFVYSDHYRVDVHGAKISKVRLDTDEALYEHGAGVLFRTDVIREIGGYDDSLRNCEDYDLLYRLKQSGRKGHYLRVPLYRYYIHGENMTLTDERQQFKKIVKDKHGI